MLAGRASRAYRGNSATWAESTVKARVFAPSVKRRFSRTRSKPGWSGFSPPSIKPSGVRNNHGIKKRSLRPGASQTETQTREIMGDFEVAGYNDTEKRCPVAGCSGMVQPTMEANTGKCDVCLEWIDWSHFTKKNLREEVAALCHLQWVHWMKHLFKQGVFHPNGTFTINKKSVDLWLTQNSSYYFELSEVEKNSDRRQADKFLEVFNKNHE